MLRFTVLMILSLQSILGSGQTGQREFRIKQEEKVDDTTLYTFLNIDSFPIVQDCDSSANDNSTYQRWIACLKTFVINNYRITPAMKHGRAGNAWVEFIVEKDGSVSNIQITRTSRNRLFDNEAIRVISDIPILTPAMSSGQTVRLKFSLPISAEWDDQ